jgi:putative ABC transport system permease protein
MMLILANMRNAIEQLWSNKLRSMLTVLGIVIAVASTITVVGVIQGFTAYVAEFLQGLGTNAMWVWPERPAGEAGKRLGRIELDIRDLDAITKGCPSLRRVSALIRRANASVRYGRDELTTPIEGVSAEYHAIRNFSVGVGRPFAVVDIERAHHVCILGRDVVNKLNSDDGIVDETILINKQRFRVIGILEEKGSFLGNSQDDIVLVPFTMALKMYPSAIHKMAMTAQATSEKAVPEARAQITNSG